MEKYDSTKRESFLTPYIELLTLNDKEKLSSKASKILYNLDYNYSLICS
jgi:hypothetical protein